VSAAPELVEQAVVLPSLAPGKRAKVYVRIEAAASAQNTPEVELVMIEQGRATSLRDNTAQLARTTVVAVSGVATPGLGPTAPPARAAAGSIEKVRPDGRESGVASTFGAWNKQS
jgi:hypothetical protein